MSRRRTFYIKAFNIYENTYNRNVYGIWAGGGAFIFGIWAGAGIYEKLAKTTKSVGYEPAMVNMAKLMKKWFFCKKLMFLNCLNGYLFVAFSSNILHKSSPLIEWEFHQISSSYTHPIWNYGLMFCMQIFWKISENCQTST